MKKIIYLLAAFAVPVLFAACSDDKDQDPIDPVLKFKNAEVTAAPTGGTYTAELESNIAWKVTSHSSNISSLNKEEGSGNFTLSFVVSPKIDDTPGSITVKAVSSPLTAILTVKQDKISIAFAPADTTASLDGGEYPTKLICNTDWVITEVFGDFEGPKLNDSGKGDHDFTLKIGTNKTDKTLIYGIAVSTKPLPQAPSMTVKFTITQGKPVVEYAGVEYKIVKLVDGRWWMADNLRYVPTGKTPSDDPDDGSGFWYPAMVSQPVKDAASIEKMGYLYDVPTALGVDAITADNYDKFEGVQGICPKGWHIPTKAEFDGIIGADSPYYVVAQKGVPIAKLEEVGFNPVLAGTVTKNTSVLVGKYAATGSGFDVNTMGYCVGSSAYQYKVNETTQAITAQMYSMLYSIAKTANRAQVAYGSVYGGMSVRCIKDVEK